MRGAVRLALIAAAAAAMCAAAPFAGSTAVDPAEAWRALVSGEPSPARVIFVDLRLSRVVFAALVGGALSMAGAVFQVALRNPLATPYTLGISSAASLGALAALKLKAAAAAVAGFALLGAAAGVAMVLAMARGMRGRAGAATLLLAGVTMNLLFSSMILVLQYFSDPFQTFAIVRWLMGGVDVFGLATSAWLAPPLLLCLAVLVAMGHRLNLLQLDDASARSLGIDPDRTRLAAIGIASAATALAVAYAGPIGFVGLILPHGVRRVLGEDHRLVLPGSAFAGAGFLVACDTIGRTAGGQVEVPVGIVTALVGGPVFLAMLLRGRVREEG